MSLLKNCSGEVSGMAADEDLIAKILQLVPTHPTLGAVMGASALRDVPTADILAAFLASMSVMGLSTYR